MSLGGIDVVWIAGAAGIFFLGLVLITVLIVRGSSKSKSKTKPLQGVVSKGAAMAQTARIDGSKPASASSSDLEKAALHGQKENAGAMREAAPNEAAMRANRTAQPVVPLPTDRIIGNFSDPSGWRSPGGRPLPPGLDNSAYALGPLGGVQSAQSLEVHPGEKYLVEYTVRMVAPPKNGKPARYVVGPMFLDATDKVLSWGSIEAPFAANEHFGRIEAEAPPTATRVHLYIGGLWAQEEPHPDGVIAYTKATLRLVKS